MVNQEKGDFVVTTTISKANQITLPSALRKEFQLQAGDEIEMQKTKEGIFLRKALTKEEKIKQAMAELDRWRNGLSDETQKLIKKHAGWTVNQLHEYYDNLPETKNYLKEKYGVKIA